MYRNIIVVKNVFCLEQSLGGKYVFVGGNTFANNHSSRGSAIVGCYQYDNACQEIATLIMPESNSTVVTVMKRSPDYPSHLILGCLKCIMIIDFDAASRSFIKLACVPHVHSNIVADIVVSCRSILSVGKGDSHISMLKY